MAEQGPDEWVVARDWCAGFLQAVDLLPEAWGDAWADPALAPLLMLGGGLKGVALAHSLAAGDLAAVDAASRSMLEAVLAQHARWHGGGARA